MPPLIATKPGIARYFAAQTPSKSRRIAGSVASMQPALRAAKNRVGAVHRYLKWIAVLVLAVTRVAGFVADAYATDDRPPKLIHPPRLVEPAMPQLSIAPDVATKVGQQVWRNETGGERDMITAWNEAEDFMSVGIGHFIWFPKGLDTRFKESFPKLLTFLRAHGAKPPRWLDHDNVPSCPWTTRAHFQRDFRGRQMSELRTFLHATVGLQAAYLVERMKAALPIILESLPTDAERAHVRTQFIRVATASPDLYPLIDYINFKGEGIAASETYPNIKTGVPEGWGLKHVLIEMNGTTNSRDAVLGEFADAAGFVLKRRIRNNPPNQRWEKGWLKRTETYRRPLR